MNPEHCSVLHVFYLRNKRIPEDTGLDAFDPLVPVVIQQNVAGCPSPFDEGYNLCWISFCFPRVTGMGRLGEVNQCTYTFDMRRGITVLATHYISSRPFDYTMAFSYFPRHLRRAPFTRLSDLQLPLFFGIIGHVSHAQVTGCEIAVFIAREFDIHKDFVINAWPHPVLIIIEPLKRLCAPKVNPAQQLLRDERQQHEGDLCA